MREKGSSATMRRIQNPPKQESLREARPKLLREP